MIKRGIILFIFLGTFLFKSYAQSNVSIKYFGFTLHPFGDYSAEIQPYKLDKKAFTVLNFGGYASYEKYVYGDLLAVRVKQGVFTDCAAGLMGVSHVGVFIKVLEKNEKHKLNIGFGPAFIYRESWRKYKLYTDTGFWRIYSTKDFGELQYKLILYATEFEYDYKISDKLDLSADLVPGFPFAFTWSFGLKYWFNRGNGKPIFLIPKSKE